MKALIAIDGSEASFAALDIAAGLDWPAGTRIEVLTVLPTDLELFGGPPSAFEAIEPSDDMHRRLERDADEILDEARTRLGLDQVDVVTRRPRGRPASTIVESADRMGADLIIIGARGHGTLERVFLGSVSSEVVDRAHCAVLVARGGAVRRILVATDGSHQATSAASFVADSGLFRSAEARVVDALDIRPTWWFGFTVESVSVVTDAYDAALTAGRERAAEATATARAVLEAGGLTVSTIVREGVAPMAILDEAATWPADLVVVGTRGHGLVKRMLLGSTARSILHRSPTSVLITRGTPAAEATATADATGDLAHASA